MRMSVRAWYAKTRKQLAEMHQKGLRIIMDFIFILDKFTYTILRSLFKHIPWNQNNSVKCRLATHISHTRSAQTVLVSCVSCVSSVHLGRHLSVRLLHSVWQRYPTSNVNILDVPVTSQVAHTQFCIKNQAIRKSLLCSSEWLLKVNVSWCLDLTRGTYSVFVWPSPAN